MRILGIDPGTRIVGYGVIDVDGTAFTAVTAGVIRASSKASLESRLAHIAREITALTVEHRPETAALEDVFVDRDPKAALTIGMGRGAILAALGQANLAVASYPPATIKKAVAGNGRAAKETVARMVGAILRLSGLPEPLDATDALAVALTHGLRHPHPA